MAITVLMLALAAIGGRLVQLQGVDNSQLAAMAEQQRLRTVTLTAPRGSIDDRDGHPIALTVDARDVYADPREVTNPTATAAKLAPVLGVPADQLVPELSKHTTFVYLARSVMPEVGQKVLDLSLAGVGILPATKRVYPDGTLASNVVGFTGIDGKGLAGLEYKFNDLLSGTDGKRTFEIGRNGSPIPDGQDHVVQPQPGTSLRLTIDRDIQWKAQQAIAAEVKKAKAKSGTVIVMNPHTGDLLAVATAPGFDANDPGAVPDSQRGDPAAVDAYEPGSVNKVITFSAALQEGLITPDSHIVVPPTYPYGGTVFHDAEVHGTEHLTATGVLAKSSNIGTIQIAEKLGADTLYHYLRAFGFGASTGSGLLGEGGGILPPTSQWSKTTLATVAFGQGVAVTALQVASVYATIANGGVRVPPSIIAGTTPPSGRFTPAKTKPGQRVISASTAHQISDMLESVTSDQGTAPAAHIDGYRVAGKTGTAQRVDPQCHCYRGYTASFVGFAPTDDPQLVVEAVVQDPTNGHYGGEVAAPVFHDVMSFALQSLKIPPSQTKPPKAKLTW